MGNVQQQEPRTAVADVDCPLASCSHCLLLVAPPGRPFRCTNPKCNRRGHPVCAACTPDVPVMADLNRRVKVAEGKSVPSVPAEVVWAAFGVTFVAVITAGVYFDLPWWLSVMAGLAFGGGVAVWLASQTEYRRAVYRIEAESIEVGRTRCCPTCGQDVRPG